MIKWISAILVCLLAGFTIARIAVPVADAPATAAASRSGGDRTLPLEQRVAALEQAVQQERHARQVLQDELMYLYGEQQARAEHAPADEQRAADNSASAAGEAAAAAARRARFERRNSPGGRAEQLVAGGFSEDLAAWIARRESELQMAALQASYDARTSGNTASLRTRMTDQTAQLRAELGDADYERYLAAIGGRTTAMISNVLETSPAQHAGLRRGDEIVRYGGERIFNVMDLNRATHTGQPGETVLVEVRRDGTTFRVTMPRGPLGIRGL